MVNSSRGSVTQGRKIVNEFMFLMKNDNSHLASLEEMQRRLQAYMNWMERVTQEGRFIAGQPLDGTGTLLVDKKTVITDGPFLEAKEMIAGYVILLARDLAEATEIAKKCPLLDHCEIMVRPLLQIQV